MLCREINGGNRIRKVSHSSLLEESIVTIVSHSTQRYAWYCTVQVVNVYVGEWSSRACPQNFRNIHAEWLDETCEELESICVLTGDTVQGSAGRNAFLRFIPRKSSVRRVTGNKLDGSYVLHDVPCGSHALERM